MSWTVYTKKQKLISEKKNTFLFYFDPKKTEDSHKLPTFIFAHWFVVPHRYYCQGAGSLTQHFCLFCNHDSFAEYSPSVRVSRVAVICLLCTPCSHVCFFPDPSVKPVCLSLSVFPVLFWRSPVLCSMCSVLLTSSHYVRSPQLCSHAEMNSLSLFTLVCVCAMYLFYLVGLSVHLPTIFQVFHASCLVLYALCAMFLVFSFLFSLVS